MCFNSVLINHEITCDIVVKRHLQTRCPPFQRSVRQCPAISSLSDVPANCKHACNFNNDNAPHNRPNLTKRARFSVPGLKKACAKRIDASSSNISWLITAWNFQWTTVKWQFKSMRKLSDHNWNKAKKEPRFNVCHCLKQMLCLFPLAWWWKIGCEIAIAANIRLIYALRQFTANTIARTYTQLIPNIFLTVNNQLEINLLQSTFQGRTSKSLVNSSGAIYGREGESPHWQARCKKTNSDLAYISVSEFFWFAIGCLFVFFGAFFYDLGFSLLPCTPGFAIISQIFCWMLPSDSPQQPVDHLQLSFPLAQTATYAIGQQAPNHKSEIVSCYLLVKTKWHHMLQ